MQTPERLEVLQGALEARLLEVHVSIPAVVKGYDATTQKISAQPVNRRAFLDETGARQTEDAVVITDIPVAFPCSLTDGMTFPVNVGDTVKLLFAESSIAMWLRRDGFVDPADDRKHALSDAVCVGWVHSFSNPIQNVSSTDVVIRAKNSLLLGDPNASDGTAGLTALTEFMDVLATVTDAAGACAALHAALVTAGWPGSFVTDKVKVPTP